MEDRVWELMGRVPDLEPSHPFEGRVWAKIREQRSRRAAWWQVWAWTTASFSPRPWVTAALAGLLLGVVVGQLTGPRAGSHHLVIPALAAFEAHPPHSIGAALQAAWWREPTGLSRRRGPRPAFHQRTEF